MLCWACDDHTGLNSTICQELSKMPLMSINTHHPDEDPETEQLQEFCWESFKEVAPLCCKCEKHPVFREEMFNDPRLVGIATAAGMKFGKENGGCVGCGKFNDEERIALVIVPEIHPTKPLLQLGEYEGKRVHDIQQAFIKAYHQAAPLCSACQSDEE